MAEDTPLYFDCMNESGLAAGGLLFAGFAEYEAKSVEGKLTVMNFWFATCKPCVGELGDLENPNKELAEKGGQVVGVNSFTLDGNKDEIADAKDVLSKKGVTYKNIWFKSESEAGKFTSNLFSFPTIYVIDQNGNLFAHLKY